MKGSYVLSVMRPGESGTIAAIERDEAGSKRLADFGFVAGTAITMVRSGAPCIVRVGRSRVAVGAGFQDLIGVVPNPLAADR